MNLDRNLTHVIKNPPKTPRPYLYTQNILNLCYNKKKIKHFEKLKKSCAEVLEILFIIIIHCFLIYITLIIKLLICLEHFLRAI